MSTMMQVFLKSSSSLFVCRKLECYRVQWCQVQSCPRLLGNCVAIAEITTKMTRGKNCELSVTVGDGGKLGLTE